jgi:hypothetical protein
VIHSNEKGTLFSLAWDQLPQPAWKGVGSKELLVSVIDSWLDRHELPRPYASPSLAKP